MTMLRICILPVIVPLLQIAFLADLIRLQLADHIHQRICKLSLSCQKHRFLTDNHSGFASIDQQFTNHRQICRTTIKCSSIDSLICDKMILW